MTERTNGELVFDIKAGTIGGGKDVLDGTALGTVHHNGAYTGLREFDVFYAPYFARICPCAENRQRTGFDQISTAVKARYPSMKYLSVARLSLEALHQQEA